MQETNAPPPLTLSLRVKTPCHWPTVITGRHTSDIIYYLSFPVLPELPFSSLAVPLFSTTQMVVITPTRCSPFPSPRPDALKWSFVELQASPWNFSVTAPSCLRKTASLEPSVLVHHERCPFDDRTSDACVRRASISRQGKLQRNWGANVVRHEGCGCRWPHDVWAFAIWFAPRSEAQPSQGPANQFPAGVRRKAYRPGAGTLLDAFWKGRISDHSAPVHLASFRSIWTTPDNHYQFDARM